VPPGYERTLLAAVAIVMLIATASPSIMQGAWAKNLPMGHPSLILQLRAGDDPRFDFFIVDKNSIEALRADIGTKLYSIIETVVLPEVKKQFDEKSDVYANGYIEYVSVNYDVKESRLDILIAKQPEEYGCDTEGCAHRIVKVNAPAELALSQVREVGMFIAVYETPSPQLVERIRAKALDEARILLSETSGVLKEMKSELIADNTPIERFFLRQYEDISRVTIFFSAFEPGGPTKQPIDVVDTSNTYYKRANSGSFESESSDVSGEEWNTAYVVGKFVNSDPPKEDQIFKVHYRVVNGNVEKFNATNGSGTGLSFGTNTESNGTLEIRFPRNYPYTNEYQYLSTGNYVPQGDINAFMIGEIDDPPYTIHSDAFGKYCIHICSVEDIQKSTTDCFFIFSVPITGKTEIGLTSTYLLWQMPHHGDQVPDSCISQTLVELTPEQLDECRRLGISEHNCSNNALLQAAQLQNEETGAAQYEQNQLNIAYYLIGIGGVIAAIMAIAISRKKD
jgi:hypothetical protein